MDKLKMETPDLTAENIEKIGALFPNVITEAVDDEGRPRRAVNFELLRQMLSTEVLEGDEAYEFTWVGKKASIVEANRPIRKTLRPCKEESRDWDTTENLYIEGDNLDVLKLLQESYLNKVKMIYIDPPYNTGNDFVYRDNFTASRVDYEEDAGVYDEDGDRLFKNTETNGRFHSDWCSMIYPRLALARNLLADDGVIFISIDDNEVAQLRKICDEVFGGSNFVQDFIWQRAFAPKNDSRYASNDHDFVLCYAKAIDGFSMGRLARTEEANERYKNYDNDPRGVWISDNLTVKTYSASYDYPITVPSGRIVNPSHGSCWRVSKGRFQELVDDNRIWFGEGGDNVPRLKRFLHELKFDGMTASSLMLYQDVGHSQEGRQELKKLFDDRGYFDGPKPVRLLSRLLTLANTDTDSIILDFFSGSATTAHAVMQLNAEDGGNRKFIMVQLPEVTDEKSEAYKAGYKNICEIGKERIRRAGDKIKADNTDKEGIENLDIGFRVLKLADTNMKDVYYSADEYSQGMLAGLESNIKEDRTNLDLLFGCLLDWGLPLSLPCTSETIDGCAVHTYNGGDLIACFDENLPESVVREIAGRSPLRVVFRDSSFAGSPEKINVEEIFKLLAQNTSVKVL